MKEFIKNIILTLFGNMPWLGTIIFAMVPIFELRGAIPIAMDATIWGDAVLPWWQAYLFSVIGATLPAFVIIPLLIPVFNWMKKTKVFRKIAEFFDRTFKKKSANLNEKIEDESQSKKKERIKFLGVVTFVAIPLPLTGAWTGSAVAAYLNINYKKGVLAILLGNIIAGAIMTLISVIFDGYQDLILLIFCLLVVVFILGSAIYAIIKARKNKKEAFKRENSSEDDKNIGSEDKKVFSKKTDYVLIVEKNEKVNEQDIESGKNNSKDEIKN